MKKRVLRPHPAPPRASLLPVMFVPHDAGILFTARSKYVKSVVKANYGGCKKVFEIHQRATSNIWHQKSSLTL